MKKLPLLLLVFGLSVLLVGCGLFGCPADERVGEISLDDDTEALIPYQGGETLTFLDTTGNSFSVFSPGVQRNLNQLCLRVICTEQKIGGRSSCEYVDSESRSYLYSSDSILIELLFFTETFEPEAEEYVDLMRLTVSFGTASATEYRVIKERYSPARIPADDGFNSLQNVGTLELGGRTFNEVYTNPDAEFIQMYYTDAEGLVAFSANGLLWTVR